MKQAKNKLKPKRKRTTPKELKRAKDIQRFAVAISRKFWPRYKKPFKKHVGDFPDIVQECILAFYKVEDRYNPKYNLSTFAYTVMKRHLIVLIANARAKKRSGKTIELSRLQKDSRFKDLPDNKAATPAWARHLEPISREKLELVEKLTDIERRRLIKHFFDGKEPKQIAKRGEGNIQCC